MPCECPWLSSAPMVAAARRRPQKLWLSPGQAFPCRAQGDVRWCNPDRIGRRKPGPQPLRRWIENDNLSLSSPSHSEQDRFMLLSYNILGDNNASYHRDLYVNVPSDIMKWDSRKDLIYQEVCRWNADVVCLQEVDRYNDILHDMKKEGYAGSYKQRTGESEDGCAMFWKEKRFHLLHADTIEFTAFGLRNNVAQLFVFEERKVLPRRVVVGNIHVLFNPKRGDIKLGQVHMLLTKAHTLSNKWGGIPVVLAGDFNCTPDSAMYTFLSTSELNITAHDRRYISGQDKLQSSLYDFPRSVDSRWTSEELKNAAGNPKRTQLRHPLKLQSSYATVQGNASTRGHYGEPVATTYHSKFIGTVDYLWYSSDLVPTRVVDTLPIDTLRSTGGLPSKEIGSDHMALVSEFVFANREDTVVESN